MIVSTDKYDFGLLGIDAPRTGFSTGVMSPNPGASGNRPTPVMSTVMPNPGAPKPLPVTAGPKPAPVMSTPMPNPSIPKQTPVALYTPLQSGFKVQATNPSIPKPGVFTQSVSPGGVKTTTPVNANVVYTPKTTINPGVITRPESNGPTQTKAKQLLAKIRTQEGMLRTKYGTQNITQIISGLNAIANLKDSEVTTAKQKGGDLFKVVTKAEEILQGTKVVVLGSDDVPDYSRLRASLEKDKKFYEDYVRKYPGDTWGTQMLQNLNSYLNMSDGDLRNVPVLFPPVSPNVTYNYKPGVLSTVTPPVGKTESGFDWVSYLPYVIMIGAPLLFLFAVTKR